VQKLPSQGQKAKNELTQEIKTQGTILGGFVGLLWVIQILNALIFNGRLVDLGIHPRALGGLPGIFFAPFLHLGFAHLIANTVPLIILGFLVMLRKKRDLLTVSALSALVGGLGTWLIAPAFSIHVGASILIFGYLGYLLSRGVFERRVLPILGSIFVFFLYGGALFGVLPGQIGVSWQGHLFGLLGGVLAARLLRTPDLKATDKAPARRRIAEIGGARARLPGLSEDDRDADAEAAKARRMR
jgi:membrane associated rhomboid family serine protease